MTATIPQNLPMDRALDLYIARLAGYRVEQIGENSYTLYSPSGALKWEDNWTEEDAWAFVPRFSSSYDAFMLLEAGIDYVSIIQWKEDGGSLVKCVEVNLCPQCDPDGRYIGHDSNGRIAWIKAYISMKEATPG